MRLAGVRLMLTQAVTSPLVRGNRVAPSGPVYPLFSFDRQQPVGVNKGRGLQLVKYYYTQD